MFQGLRQRVDDSVSIAASWLSSQLYNLDRHGQSHDLAIVAYALHVADSPNREEAFQVLSKYRQEVGVYMFWGTDQNHQPPAHGTLLQPNSQQCCDALAVRATAYGLLTYNRRREFIKKPIVNWLNSRRHSATKWSSTFDSSLALKALVEYALDNKGMRNTDLSVKVHFTGNVDKKKTFYMREVDSGPLVMAVKNFYGHVKVETSGLGRVLVQLTNSYRHKTIADTSKEMSPVNAYDLIAQAELINNDSVIVLSSCQK